MSVCAALVRINIKCYRTGKCRCLIGNIRVKNTLTTVRIQAIKTNAETDHKLVNCAGIDKETLRGIDAEIKIEIHAQGQVDRPTGNINTKTCNPQIVGKGNGLVKEIPVNVSRKTDFINVLIINGDHINILAVVRPVYRTKLLERGFKSMFHNSVGRHQNARIVILEILDGFRNRINQPFMQVFKILCGNTKGITDKGQVQFQQTIFDLTFKLAEEIIQPVQQQARVVQNATSIKTVTKIGTGDFDNFTITKIVTGLNTNTGVERDTTNG